MAKIYMDVCCWNRPFDDQTQVRVRLEAEAIIAIILEIERGHLELLHSEIIDLEIENTPGLERRERLEAFFPHKYRYIDCDEEISTRALELERIGFFGMDALHLASAELAGADIFFTTDDRLLKAAARNANFLRVRVANPLAWLQNKGAD